MGNRDIFSGGKIEIQTSVYKTEVKKCGITALFLILSIAKEICDEYNGRMYRDNKDKGLSIEIIRSNRKTMVLEITPDCKVRVRAPHRISDSDIQRFIREKSDWIAEKLHIMKERQAHRISQPKLTTEEIRNLAEQALADIPKRVACFAPCVGVSYGRITIRNQRTRWGSCSSKGNLNFNCLLMLAPPEVRDYVVVHELCHRKEMNHSPHFWAEVEKVLPDYKEAKRWLKEHGGAIMERMTG